MALFGWIDLRRPMLSTLTLLLNILCTVAAVDFVYRSHVLHPSTDLHFSRMGYVSESTASIVIRAPDYPFVELTARKATTGTAEPWPVVVTIATSPGSDFMGTFQLEGLSPGTDYIYHTNANHHGSFRTAVPDKKKWTFVSTSCIKPFYPYNPLDHALRIKGLEYLSEYATRHTLDFVLFLGDFIYVDLPYPLGWSREHYTELYRQVYASRSWSSVLTSIPWLHVYDDHEIINDFHPGPKPAKTVASKVHDSQALYDIALQPFWHYQGHANPNSQYGRGETYYSFKHGDVAFFVLDTRRYRSPADTPDRLGAKTMLGPRQLRHLRNWLETEKAWKVVVSSVPFTRNWRGPDASDSWAGYLAEREVVFDMMRATDGVVLLSGVGSPTPWAFLRVSSLKLTTR
jgi:alkaline phosphatase D